MLNLQNYRLAYWRTADQELGYRRFFDINSLIGMRVERPHVFNATHSRVMEWLRNGVLDGVRVDHPDGLRDPGAIFRAAAHRALPMPGFWPRRFCEPGESLRASWPIAGTTGYDFLNVCNGLLVYGEGPERAHRDLHANSPARRQDFESLAHAKKLNVAHEALRQRCESAGATVCGDLRKQSRPPRLHAR